MPLTLPPGEPEAGPWERVTMQALLNMVLAAAGSPSGRPRIVAIDGRGASGKSTLWARLQALAPASTVVHTDDLAWHEPLFAWGPLLAEGILRPLHPGQALSYRPPQWERRGRAGSIVVPADSDVVFVEGTGASQREHAELVDATVWVQADVIEAERRGIARDVAEGVNGDPDEAAAFWHQWMGEEVPFLDRQRPWQRACVVVHGTPEGQLDTDHVEVAAPPHDGQSNFQR